MRLGGNYTMAYGVFLAVPMLETGVLLAEADVWQAMGPYFQNAAPDAGAPKKFGEWLLAGSAHAPGGAACASWEAEVQVGAMSKRLRVLGPRQWTEKGLSPPEPVTAVSMAWRHAWGGTGVADNPEGCGMRDPQGQVQVPCIEMPGHPWTSPERTCVAACTLPVNELHPRKQRYAGTIGLDYSERFYPGLPDDFNWRLFNLAPEDQQMDGMWHGDEAFRLTHWHPQHACIEGRLPGLRVALHAAQGDGPLERIDLRLSTVWFFPEHLMTVVYFHGSVPCTTLGGTEVTRVIAGVEPLQDAPLPAAHYEEVWRQRTNRTPKGAAMALDDSLLCPVGFQTRFKALDQARERHRPHPALSQMGQRLAQLWSKASEEVKDLGRRVPVAPGGAPGTDPASHLMDLTEDAQQLMAEMAGSFERVAQLCDTSAWMDPQRKIHELMDDISAFRQEMLGISKVLEDRRRQVKAQELEKLHTEKLLQDLQDLQAMAVAHPSRGQPVPANGGEEEMADLDIQTGAKDPGPLGAQDVRESIAQLKHLADASSNHLPQKAREQQQSDIDQLALWMSGSGGQSPPLEQMLEELQTYSAMLAQFPSASMPASVSGDSDHEDKSVSAQSFPQFVPLKEATLQSPDPQFWVWRRLKQRKVVGWSLRGMDLRGFEFDEVSFVGCDLREAQLGQTRWRNCTWMGCDLSGARMEQAEFDGLTLNWSCLDGVQAAGSQWKGIQMVSGSARGAQWPHSHWSAATVLKADLSHSVWKEASLMRLVANQAQFVHTRFEKTSVQHAAWTECDLGESCWTDARLTITCMLKGELPTQWQGARLDMVNLHGGRMSRGQWQGAVFNNVNMGEVQFRDCDFSQVRGTAWFLNQSDLRDCDFSRTQLDNCTLLESDLRGCRFEKATLRSCWLGLSQIDGSTEMASADTFGSVLHPKREAQS